jgi:tetratricopeptide (TPR) repeat protein
LTRPLDKHLDSEELDGLVSPRPSSDTGSPPAQTLAEVERHLESCQDCSRKVQMHKSVQNELARLRAPGLSARGSDCLTEAEWLNVAAGLLSETKTTELMKHAAQCGHCGPLLKNAAETLAGEATPGEERFLASLRSAQPRWQKNMAEALRNNQHDRRRETRVSWRNALFSWPSPAFAVAGIAIAVLAAWFGSRLLHPPSAEQLLAQAYAERRTLEVRIPGAKYAPIRVERAAAGSNLDKSPSLLKAEALISENLRKNPNDPAELQAKARAELLDGNYESAIKSLRRALETRPDSPPLLMDLGSAYFVRAEAADRAVDYGNALEALGKALAKTPDDPVALFNRALVCERMFLYTQAMDDWEHYLRVDPRGEWAEEARANLQRVQQKKAEREKRAAIPLLSPAEFVAAIDANHEDAVIMLDQRAERYLEAAIQSWLPQAFGVGTSATAPGESRRALEYLAEILRTRHDDTWLSDFLQSQPSQIEAQALHFLLSSDEALHSGRYGLSVELATKSVRDFERTSNQAGMLRASFALLLAQSVTLQYGDCIRTARRAIPLLSSTRYRWLQIQTAIQQAQCEAIAAVEGPLQATLTSAQLAKRFHYPGLQLRATAFAAAYRSDTGSSNRGMRDLLDGLATFWQSDASSARGENLYSALFDFASARNWPYTDVFATAELLADFPVKDPVDQAVQRELLALAEEQAGDYPAAQSTLQRIAALMAALPEDSAVTLRKAEIALENAKIQLHLGDANGAVATLSVLRPQFEMAAPGLFQAEYFKTYGEASLALGLNSAAEPLLARALSVTETGLKSLHSEADKLAWSRDLGQLYRDLLEIKLKFASPAAAMAWWEWYKGASLRTADPVDNPAASNDYGIDSFAPPDTSRYSLPPGTALISYAVLRNSTTAFIFRDGNVQTRTLQLPDDATLRPLHFLSLCADPSANLDSFHAESRRLFEILVAPLESDIQGAAALRIETDGILDQIPFDLLRDADGRYLVDRFEVTYSPGLAYRSRSNYEGLSTASLALIVVASGAQDPALAPLPDAADEGREVASHFRQATVLSVSPTRADVLQNLRDAQLFHFVGHAIAGVDRVGLVIGPDAVIDSQDLVKLRLRNLSLAVLSACDTANGEGGTFADVNSMARTLAVAGVPQTVASRWQVDSAVTRELMRAFYASLMSGKTPANSLRDATAAVRSKPGYQHPYYWASFAVYGSS